MSKRYPGSNPWKAAGLVGIIGIDIVVCITAGYFCGVYISKKAGGGLGWIAAGILAGMAVGILSVAIMIKRFLEDSDD